MASKRDAPCSSPMRLLPAVRQGNQSCDTTEQMPRLEIDARQGAVLFSVESSFSFSFATEEVVRDIWMGKCDSSSLRGHIMKPTDDGMNINLHKSKIMDASIGVDLLL